MKVKAVTRSSRPRVEESFDGSLKVYVCAAPVKGKANREVVQAVAEYLCVPKSSVRILRGHAGSEKLLEVVE